MGSKWGKNGSSGWKNVGRSAEYMEMFEDTVFHKKTWKEIGSEREWVKISHDDLIL
jgi:hypothetical protein